MAAHAGGLEGGVRLDLYRLVSRMSGPSRTFFLRPRLQRPNHLLALRASVKASRLSRPVFDLTALSTSRLCSRQRCQGSKKSVGHSNVLAPEHRSAAGAQRILMELARKALTRLKRYQQMASAVHVTVKYRGVQGVKGDADWTQQSTKHLHTAEESFWVKVLRPLLDSIPDLAPNREPFYVGIIFGKLLLEKDRNLSLFEEDDREEHLAHVDDALHQKFGRVVEVGGMHGASGQVPLRIAFGAPDGLLPNLPDNPSPNLPI